MMRQQQHPEWEQLNLLLPGKNIFERRKFDPEIRKEVIELLELLLDECVARTVGKREVSNEQNKR
jgi:hypothetical protein